MAEPGIWWINYFRMRCDLARTERDIGNTGYLVPPAKPRNDPEK